MPFVRRLPDQLAVFKAAHFDRNERYAYFGDKTLALLIVDGFAIN
jgi:hypothetical protein